MSRLILRGARLLDPAQDLDAVGTIVVSDGGVTAVVAGADADALETEPGDEVVDLDGHWLVPGLVDLRCSLREPGYEYKEDIHSGLRAAAAGGWTSVCALPDTDPVMDCAAVVAQVRERAATAGGARLLPVGAATKTLDDETLAPVAELRTEGCVAVTQGERPISSARLMRRTLEYCSAFAMPVVSSALEATLTGLCDEGPWSTRLGLPSTPAAAEAIAVSRDLALAELTGCRLHLTRVTTRRGLELIAAARERGVSVTCDVTAHHLTYTVADLVSFDPNLKVWPPLRSEDDRAALQEGVASGLVDAIVSDHQPHHYEDKARVYANAATGVSALETTLPLVLRLVDAGAFPLQRALTALTSGARAALGLPQEGLKEGSVADLTIIDPEASWIADPASIQSRGKNTPLLGQVLTGRAALTVVGGRVVWRAPADALEV